MNLVVSETSLGTAESDWLACRRLVACPPVACPPVACPPVAWGEAGPVVVVAPHPDDEVLAVGGALRQLARRGHPISVIAVTDGEASHPHSKTTSRETLARLRARERAVALCRLGVGDRTVVRIHVRDGQVSSATDLAQRLAPLVEGAAVVFAPWHRDGHPDHDAVGVAARVASEEVGVHLLQYPVWAWHWARPDSDDLPWDRARRIDLDPDTVRAKDASIEAFRSQIAPLSAARGDEAILPRSVLARFRRPFEVVFE